MSAPRATKEESSHALQSRRNHYRDQGTHWEIWRRVWRVVRVGTAKDPRSPLFESHRVAEMNDGLTYREAFTAGSGVAQAYAFFAFVCGSLF